MRKSGKFFTFLVILILACGAVFYFGYTPFKVPHDCIGVMVSKTGGVNEKPVERGVFRWDWEFLIPTNAKINSFQIKPFSYSKFVTGKLPSADIYSNQFEVKPDFSYSFNFDIQFTYTPSKCVELVKKTGITNDAELAKLIKARGDELCDKCISVISDMSEKKFSFDVEQFKERLIKENNDDDFKIISISISNVSVPDFELYASCKQMYQRYVASVDQKLQGLVDSQAREIADYAKNLNKLEQFGKVLKEHPELAEFLKSSGDLNETLRTINSFR